MAESCKQRKFKNAIDEEGQKEYRKLRNEIIRNIREKDEYLNEICEEINRELIANNLDKAYRMVRKLFGEGKKKASIIKDEKSQLLYEEKEIVNRWKEYLQKLYGDEPMNGNGDEPLAELLKNCGEKAKDVLFKIISSMYKTGQIPNLEKAFDNVNWDIMFDTLKKTGASYRDRRKIHSLYKNEIGVIKSGASEEEAKIMKEAINKIREKGGVGINIHGEKIDMLRFADDIAVLAENENDLQNTLNIMNDTMRDEFKMKINIKKTKILISSRRSLITAEGTSKKEIVSRINQAKCAFNKKKNLFTSRSIDINIRKNLIKTYVWSVVLYGSETWTIAKAEENRLLAFEAWCWRRMQGISWREHMTNDEVFAKAKERRCFMKSLKKRRTKLIGHILRYNSLLKRIMEGMIVGKNVVGRPLLNYLQQIMRDVDVPGYKHMKRKAENREEWRVATNQPHGC
ncbi:Reverse transcriptase domain [Cinara cedri]|uniref:Reverse transcriptase domain n=1 Tax=Cinara cedri TaxID=506608 RepID=A0A5E4N8Y5_9HEMI|nr:Reverse transcriptase domain [Cinara cedri]